MSTLGTKGGVSRSATGDATQTRAILARFAPAGITMSPMVAQVARSRLGAIALAMACLTVLSFVANTLLGMEAQPLVPGNLRLYLAELGIVLDLAMLGIAWKSRASDEEVLNYGFVYEFLRCGTLTLSPMPEAGAPVLSWVAVLVVLFPMLLPERGLRATITVVASAATQPLAVALLDISGEIDGADYARVVIASVAAAALGLIGRDLMRRYHVDAPKELGSYDLVDRLGRGGMGEVWRASHRFLARPAAIKLIPRNPSDDKHQAQKKLRRFRREAQVTANLTSPHTVAVYDFGVTDAGVYYYVMEHLVGMDLQDLVQKEGALTASRSVHLLAQACDSLAEAHDAGLIHRDLKPSNLFVVRQGIEPDFVKVLDFGLVGLLDPLTDQSINLQITAQNMMTGTPAYMSPEMVLGTEIDARADIYGMGCILYFLTTGELVFPGLRGMPMATAHAHEMPRSPATVRPGVPDDLDQLIMECLEKDPSARPQTALILQQRLRALACAREWERDEALRWWNEKFPNETTTSMKIAVRRGEEETAPVVPPT